MFDPMKSGRRYAQGGEVIPDHNHMDGEEGEGMDHKEVLQAIAEDLKAGLKEQSTELIVKSLEAFWNAMKAEDERQDASLEAGESEDEG